MNPLVFFGLAYVAIPITLAYLPAKEASTPRQPEATPTDTVSEPDEDPLSTPPADAPAEKPVVEVAHSNEDIVRMFTIQTWGEQEWPAMHRLVMKESGFKNNAQNKHSTAYGMFQFLDSTWKGYGFTKTSDPIGQTEAGIAYIKARYGTPSNALQFHLKHNWY